MWRHASSFNAFRSFLLVPRLPNYASLQPKPFISHELSHVPPWQVMEYAWPNVPHPNKLRQWMPHQSSSGKNGRGYWDLRKPAITCDDDQGNKMSGRVWSWNVRCFKSLIELHKTSPSSKNQLILRFWNSLLSFCWFEMHAKKKTIKTPMINR